MIMTALEILLEKRWVLKHQNPWLFYQIKDELKEYEDFIKNKLGYKILETPHLIKINKIPGQVETWMGLEAFNTTDQYVYLCLILMFLEDKSKGEQFILSDLAEYIKAQFPQEGYIDWTIYSQRKGFINTLKYCYEEGLFLINDGEIGGFIDNESVEVLYENTGVSRYYMRRFMTDIMDYTSLEDFQNSEWIDVEEDKGLRRRHRVYRRIVMSPAVYMDNEAPDNLYIKNQYSNLQNDMDKYLNADLHIHKNGAYLILPEDTALRDTFPSGKNISDIVLQMNTLIWEYIQDGQLEVLPSDRIRLSRLEWDHMMKQCHVRFSHGWSKTYRDMKISKLEKEIIAYMKTYQMITLESSGEAVWILPISGKFTGDYPRAYYEKRHAQDE